MEEFYKEDLAFIHDAGFRDFALKSAPGILEILDRNRIREGLVVDLGCGSGLWARELTKARYQVLGVDISEAMIRIARQRVPDAEFLVGSLFAVDIPTCSAVTSLSECLNYLFDPNNNDQTMSHLFKRIYNALRPGGLFIFDVAGPGQVARGTRSKGFTEGDEWVVLVEKEEDHKQSVLTRRIISFRKAGESYRRADESHRQRLYKPADVRRQLRQAGFRVRTVRNYGRHPLPKANAAFIARKPE